MRWWFILVTLLIAVTPVAGAAAPATTRVAAVPGYRGIWFTLGQKTKYGDKYSGGLGTYTANHVPIAVYSPKADKTFFVYGGTTAADERHLLIMASYYDHATGTVPRPTVVHDKQAVNDPHDNAAIALDDAGYVWVFVSGRARARPGYIYRSVEPYRVDAFEQVAKREMTYPQPKYVSGRGFFYLFTKYTAGRELYWQTSADGASWSEEKKLAGFGGHYQVSGTSGDGTIGTAFMWHPEGKVDRRTNLYYLQTRDFGKTWTAANGKRVDPPLTSEANDALLIDYRAQGKLVYIHDLNFDARGNPVILYLVSSSSEPGPDAGLKQWKVTRWDGSAWQTHDVCTSDHNYDTGCLLIDGSNWTVTGPTEPGPQAWGTGGEMSAWSSADEGATWRKVRQLTAGSTYNHSYARRVLHGKPPFEFLWADGDPYRLSASRLYFGSTGGPCYVLPYDMTTPTTKPIDVSAPR
jgi:hypothetical protein